MALFSRKSSEASRAPVPFIVGVGRSGTTMLRLMLDAHPDLAIPPETHFVPDLIDAIEAGASPEQAVATMTAVRQWGDLHTDPADVVARWRTLNSFAPGPALRAFYAIYAERQGIPFAGWNSNWRFLFLGVILLLAVAGNNYVRRKAEQIR